MVVGLSVRSWATVSMAKKAGVNGCASKGQRRVMHKFRCGTKVCWDLQFPLLEARRDRSKQ